MDIDRVRYFCAFADTGSLVKAAEILNISQPALSKALRLLEREVGLKLLEPDGRGLRLTDGGGRFRAAVAPLLAQWLELPNLLQGAPTPTVTKLGSFEVFTTYFLGHWLKNLLPSRLEVHELGPGRMEEAVADGRVDVGITYLPIPKKGIEFVGTTRISMGVYGVRKFRDAQAGELPFVVPIQCGQGTPSKVVGLDGWPDHKFPRAIAFKVTMMESALELCRRGHAVAYLPEFIVRLHNETTKAEFQLVELKCSIPKPERLQKVFLIQREGMRESVEVRSVARALRSLT